MINLFKKNKQLRELADLEKHTSAEKDPTKSNLTDRPMALNLLFRGKLKKELV